MELVKTYLGDVTFQCTFDGVYRKGAAPTTGQDYSRCPRFLFTIPPKKGIDTTGQGHRYPSRSMLDDCVADNTTSKSEQTQKNAES